MDYTKYFEAAFKDHKFEELRHFTEYKSIIDPIVPLTSYEKLVIYFSVPPNLQWGLSKSESLYISELFSVLRGQVAMECQKKILNYIRRNESSNNQEYFIDLIEELMPELPIGGVPSSLYSENIMTLIRKFTQCLVNVKCENLITNGRITSEYISNSPAYVLGDQSQHLRTFSVFSKHGMIGGKSVYIDNMMRYDDNEILICDSIIYDIKDINLEMTQDSNFPPTLKVNFNFAFRVYNPGLIWVIENTSSKGFDRYKSILRGKRIDDLLG